MTMILNPNKILLKILSARLGRSATRLELAPRIKAIGGKLPELTEGEKDSINRIWRPTGAGNIDFNYWKLYKCLWGGKLALLSFPTTFTGLGS